jgi:dynein heavy chain
MRGSLEIQWSTLRYLIGEGQFNKNHFYFLGMVFFSSTVMYGGRVIDSYDRRIIRTYMQEYFGDFVFDYFQPFHFFLDTNKPLKYDYFIPEIRDFLSIKQRWVLKEANISVCHLFFLHFVFYSFNLD